MPFQHSITARFYEIDRAGIVFFGRFFEYCHATFEEFLSVAFGSGDAPFDRYDWVMPLVHAEADFQRPVRMGDRLTVHMRVERLGEQSVTFLYDVRDAHGDPCARVRLVHAIRDRDSFRARTIPAELRDALERLDLLPQTPSP